MPDIAQLLGLTAGKFAQSLPGLFNQLAQQNIGGSEGYAQQQENERQKAALAQQLQLHNSLSADQAAQLVQTQQLRDQQAKQLEGQQQLQLLNLLQGGGVKQAAPGEPGGVPFGSNTLSVVPEDQRPGMFKFEPTQQDLTNYPWLPKTGVTMQAKDFPDFITALGKLQKTAPGASAAYDKLLQNQLNQIIDPNDPMRSTYSFMLHDAIQPADGSAPDHKRALMILDDLRKSKQSVIDERRKQALQFSPEAISGAATKAGAEEGARQEAMYQQAVKNLPDSTLKYWYDQVKRGAQTYGDVLSRFDKTGKERFANFLADIGDEFPVALDANARKTLSNLDPVLDSLKQVRDQIQKAGIAQDTTPGSMAKARLLYSLGVGDKAGGLISTGEMDRLRGAAQSLQGLRTALPTLEQAQIHTPNFWMDSGKLMTDKLNNMINYLTYQENAIEKYGAKTGIVRSHPDAGTAKPPEQMRPPIVIPPPPK